MFKTVKMTAVFAAAISIMAVASLFLGNNAHATSDIPLEIIPRCSSADRQLSYYEVNNKNDENVDITFTNTAANAHGTFTATPGTSALYVGYNPSDPNNTTQFQYQNLAIPTQTNPNSGTTCGDAQLPAPTCVDGTNASNLRVIWMNDSQITITTKSGLPLCNDVTLYYSIYQMPNNYNGQGFSIDNPTSYPQTGVGSYTFTLEANTFGTWLKDVPAPDYCYNIQADLYYGPEVTNIGGDAKGYHADRSPVANGYGHGTQNIASQIFARDDSQCNPGMGGGNGNGGGNTTAPTGGNGAGQTVTTSVPSVLPNTGPAYSAANIASALMTLLFGAIGLMTMGLRTLRR